LSLNNIEVHFEQKKKEKEKEKEAVASLGNPQTDERDSYSGPRYGLGPRTLNTQIEF